MKRSLTFVAFTFIASCSTGLDSLKKAELLDANITSTSVQSTIKNGSFVLKDIFSDGSARTISIVGPLSPKDNPKVRVERTVTIGESKVLSELSHVDVRDFVSKRLVTKGDLSVAESGFLAVLLIYKEELGVIKHWGMGGSEAINNGNWQKVFRDPSSALSDLTNESGERIEQFR